MKRLNLIEEELAGLDFGIAPGFVVNGLKREQLITMNSMILHEVFFDGPGEESEPGSELVDALAHDFGSLERWRAEFTRWARHRRRLQSVHVRLARCDSLRTPELSMAAATREATEISRRVSSFTFQSLRGCDGGRMPVPSVDQHL